ncbi:hypothetical protein [Mesorhizobium sp. WSM4884]|uniref:hypothetical protein n=1 Tax=Mesorhizobium sp. WSM4884 TaxID=3038542 RepID=UPI002418102A|nr:hypothetical protein [Mesorhizobium sp. WSM4884]MDG4884156.1 hypothetical protein [Mesorhizobium sp. WSM4884]
MEFAVCYDHSGTDLALSIFLYITAFLVILAPLAAARLIEKSRADSVERLEMAW